MEITEVRIKLMSDPQDRLQAFCSITIDGCFVVRDLKIIQGNKGSFVAMPSRKLTNRCPKCHSKNHLRSNFCNQCGVRMSSDKDDATNNNGRTKLYADIAHPINSECREIIQSKVIEAFELEIVNSQKPGYVCRYDDYGEEEFGDWMASQSSNEKPAAEDQPQATVPAPPPKPEVVEYANGQQLRFDPAESEESQTSPSTNGHAVRNGQESVPQSANAAGPRDEDFGQGIV